MFEKRVFFLLFFVASLAFFGCNDYRKVLKSTDLDFKYKRAIQYYEKEDYYRALPLIEELHAIYRGTSKAEKLAYYQAFCEFKLKDYVLAGHRFDQFTKTYPVSEHAEECQFMSAICHYRNSPNPALDQTDTKQAIQSFQLFVNRYPTSRLVDSSNTLIDELRFKLERKALGQAKLYFRTRNYKSAIIALNNLLEEFPDTDKREEIQFMALRSHYLLAINSVTSKKSERLDDAVKSYRKFVDSFPSSSRLGDAESIYNNVLKEQEKYLANQNL